MNFAILALSLAFGGGAHASDKFAGTWTGPGFWSKGDRNSEIPTTTLLTISETSTSFRFEECWDYKDRQDGSTKHSCIESSYSRNPDDSLWSDGKKVGDIFSDHVQIFVGNSQVGEQIVMEEKDQGELHYRYSYVNFDGATERREAVLRPAP